MNICKILRYIVEIILSLYPYCVLCKFNEPLATVFESKPSLCLYLKQKRKRLLHEQQSLLRRVTAGAGTGGPARRSPLLDFN